MASLPNWAPKGDRPASDLHATGGEIWFHWIAPVAATAFGIYAAPTLSAGRVPVLVAYLLLGIAVLTMLNLATWSGTPWFLWPGGALVFSGLLYLVLRRDA